MLILLTFICVLFLALSTFVTLKGPFAPKKYRCFGPWMVIFVYVCAIIQVLMTFFAYRIYGADLPISAFPEETLPNQLRLPDQTQLTAESEKPDPRRNFTVTGSESANPENFGITWEIAVGDEIVESYLREESICFELDREYFALPGVATFRGNNYRNGGSYGTAVIEQETMGIAWSHPIGSLNKWGGCAWTGQPLLVQWDAETKAIMTNMYDSKKEQDGLVEVIYATLDGYIHFYDLENGNKTRDPIKMGMNFKGAGALDPRGYPLLYVGSGLNINGKNARMFIVSLIDGQILYEYGHEDSFGLRDWTAFDASPLVDAETDTLIWPGETGVLYTVKLNTQYDKAAGTISISPEEPVKSRYTSTYSRDEKRYLGYEASAVIVDRYLYVSENGGLFHCIDLNTMQLLWAQDIKDVSNSTPVFEWDEEGNGYIYTAPSLHWTAENHEGSIKICKLNASTGEILWEYQRECLRYDDIAGGVQCTPLLGREGTRIAGLVIYAIGRTPSAYRGVLVALDTKTGEKIWEISSGNYAWSSPTALYTEDGHAYIFLANASGVARLIDGATGEVLCTLDFGQTVEASPVVFDNMLVIGSREAVYGIKVQ